MTDINKQNEQVEQVGQVEQIVINKTYRANSYEFGKAGNRFKLYFEDADDLKTQIDNLIKLGLYKDEERE